MAKPGQKQQDCRHTEGRWRVWLAGGLVSGLEIEKCYGMREQTIFTRA